MSALRHITFRQKAPLKWRKWCCISESLVPERRPSVSFHHYLHFFYEEYFRTYSDTPYGGGCRLRVPATKRLATAVLRSNPSRIPNGPLLSIFWTVTHVFSHDQTQPIEVGEAWLRRPRQAFTAGELRSGNLYRWIRSGSQYWSILSIFWAVTSIFSHSSLEEGNSTRDSNHKNKKSSIAGLERLGGGLLSFSFVKSVRSVQEIQKFLQIPESDGTLFALFWFVQSHNFVQELRNEKTHETHTYAL